MDFLFFVMYNMYYKDGNYKNDMPAYTVFMQFTACVFGVLWGGVSAFYWYYKDSCYDYASLSKGFLALICAMTITYFLFYHNNRYKKIYLTYKDNVFARSFLARVISVLVMFCMLLFSLIVIYFQRKYDLCPLYR